MAIDGVVFHFKRFDNRGHKQNGDIELPLEWRDYVLSAVVLHWGRQLTSGHYTALVRAGGAWHHCNDSSVGAMGDQEAAAASAHTWRCTCLSAARGVRRPLSNGGAKRGNIMCPKGATLSYIRFLGRYYCQRLSPV